MNFFAKAVCHLQNDPMSIRITHLFNQIASPRHLCHLKKNKTKTCRGKAENYHFLYETSWKKIQRFKFLM